LDECGNVVKQGVRRRSGMEPIAVEMVRDRRRPSHPGLMQTTCPILGVVSAWYPSSVHGYSTTAMASMFKSEYLVANLARSQMCNMVAYIYTGLPLQRSAYDGLRGQRMTPFAAPQAPLVSPRDLESYIESILRADVDLPTMLRDPAKPAAVQADGKYGNDGVEGREDNELQMTGYETLDSDELDFLVSDRDGCEYNPFAKAVLLLPGLDVVSGESGDDGCGSASPVGLATPVDGVGSKRMWSRPPSPHDQKHVSIAKKRKTVSHSSLSSRLSYERKHWSAQEDECIMVYYEKHGAKWRDMARALAAETLSSRSDDALRNRHYRLTAHRDESSSTTSSESCSSTSTASKPRQKRVAWSISEDELILNMVSNSDERLSWQRISELLPGRTAHAIRNRANRLFMERERTHIVNASPLEESEEDTRRPLHPLVEVGLKLAGWRGRSD
jgi:hypothetical protein